MKNVIRISAAVGIAVLLAASAYFVWSNFFGTALNNRVKLGSAAAKSAQAAGGRISEAESKAKSLPQSWAALKFDEETEVNKILEDSTSNRGYKVDVLRDASAARVQQDIIAAESELSYAIADAQKAIKTIDKVSWYLPAASKADFNKAKADAKRSIRTGEALAKNLKELKNDVDIWGYLAVSIRINSSIMETFGQVSGSLAAGDYATAATGAQQILVGVNESVTWLSHGKQELTNVSVYSKDSDAILDFISKAKTTAETFNNAAAAGERGEAEKLEATRQLAESQLAGLRKTASEKSVATDYINWLLRNAERRLGIPKP